MGLFKKEEKDEALGEKMICCKCGTIFYEVLDRGCYADQRLQRKGFIWDYIYLCKKCGTVTCRDCIGMSACRCGSWELILMNVVREKN